MATANKTITEFRLYLFGGEKAKATVEKYARDAEAFFAWLGGRDINKETALEYKEHLKENYAAASVNAAIASLNSFFEFMGRSDLRLRSIKLQRRIFSAEDRELDRKELKRLIDTAKRMNKKRLRYMLSTMLATGIRISELRFITVESAEQGEAHIDCKGKQRKIILPHKLCRMLKKYANEQGIKSGAIFITRNGNPVDRSNFAKELKKLAELAKVAAKKVFPHNIRHLFARIYYSVHKDLNRLADILGHSNINTTRIYTMESGKTHRQQIEALGLV